MLFDSLHRYAEIWLYLEYLREQIACCVVYSFTLVLYITLQNGLLNQNWIVFFFKRQPPKNCQFEHLTYPDSNSVSTIPKLHKSAEYEYP